jgi:hypothetical protein
MECNKYGDDDDDVSEEQFCKHCSEHSKFIKAVYFLNS